MAMERRWKGAGLVGVGVVLHALYMLSIFDIYFKSPIVHGMDPVPPRIHAPAKRLVLFIADGLRADKFFEMDPDGSFRAPFLRKVIKEKGRWGVSHARPPTESRPGHVAIIAGFYEDPSAVTKGWKANPVEFDSLFNRSRSTFAFGSPDIVPMFCGDLTQSYWKSYPHEYEDFATDASFLDEWSFNHLQELLLQSKTNSELKLKLEQDQVVIFLHLLGCDTNGHAHRPYSSIYLKNIRVVDYGVQKIFELMEEYFPDGRTAFVFTADHGMSDKGSHGDGDPANTDTPLIAWGAGVRSPSPAITDYDVGGEVKFVDEHEHHLPTPPSWGLSDVERVDVNQADITPLMSTLLGLPCPVNSIGTLPVSFLDLDQRDQVEAVFSNAKTILNQFLRKSHLKQATSLHFKPFTPLADHQGIIRNIETLINQRQYNAALIMTKNLINLSLEGLHYLQTYDWLALMTIITLGYLGWMVYIFLYVVKNYTSLPRIHIKKGVGMESMLRRKKLVWMMGCILMCLCSVVLLIEHAPLLYHFYLASALFLWIEILNDMTSLRRLWSAMGLANWQTAIKTTCALSICLLILELLVLSFFKREVYTGVFLLTGVIGAVAVSCNSPALSMVPAFVWASCWFLSGFTLMPAQIPDNTFLVVCSGILVVIIGFGARHFDFMLPNEQALRAIVSGPVQKADSSWRLFLVQVLLVVASIIMVWISTSYTAQKRGLLLIIQLINWLLAGSAVILPLLSPCGILARLLSVFLGFTPVFLLLSIGYEALFYSGLALVLMSWILVEAAMFYSPIRSYSPHGTRSSRVLADRIFINPSQPVTQHYRQLELIDIRVGLCFLILINVAFFGTGNVASIASFEISSVYRFITIFNPFLMAALLLFKLLIPFILVTCAFSAIIKLLQLPRLGCYFMVLFLSDVMTIHFFFLVRNTGSWMEIGQTISHFGIMSAQVVFVLLLFAITNVFTRDIFISPQQQELQKAV